MRLRVVIALVLGLTACASDTSRIEALNAALLASSSATQTLEQWCAEHRMAEDPRIVAVRIRGVDKPPSSEQLQRLGVASADEVKYRHVELRCGTHVFSVADNWYVPARLTPEMNRTLETTDTPFGKVVRSLQPYRKTIATAKLASRHSRELFQHRALLYTSEHQPFAEVVETYQRDVLAFR